MALREINLSSLVDLLDEEKSEYADFFRPMLGYEAVLTLHDGIEDNVESLIVEIEDETGYEFPSDLVSFYMCTNGGKFGDLTLFPITNDKNIKEDIHKLNVLDKSLKEQMGLDNKTLLIGKYENSSNYVTCSLNDDDVYTYQLWNSAKKSIAMEFELLIQLIALEVSYVTDYEGLMDFVNSDEE